MKHYSETFSTTRQTTPVYSSGLLRDETTHESGLLAGVERFVYREFRVERRPLRHDAAQTRRVGPALRTRLHISYGPAGRRSASREHLGSGSKKTISPLRGHIKEDLVEHPYSTTLSPRRVGPLNFRFGRAGNEAGRQVEPRRGGTRQTAAVRRAAVLPAPAREVHPIIRSVGGTRGH